MAKSGKSPLERLRHYCAYQERCHSEVRNKLLELGVKGNDLEEIIAGLIQEDFLNEERFAKVYVSGKLNIKGWGKIKIIQGLKQKKISEYCIKKAMEGIDPNLYFSIAEKMIVKKWESLIFERNVLKRKHKTFQYALWVGFEPNIIQEVMRDFLDK